MKKNMKKKVLLTMSVALLLLVAVGATLAYVFTETNPVENTFKPAQVSCAVVEANGTPVTGAVINTGEIKTDVQIQNTGNTGAYIRADIVVTWKNNAGEVYAVTPVRDVDYSIDLNDGNIWFPGDDGFYYFHKEVAPITECSHAASDSCANCCTDVLIKSCSQKAGANVPAGYHLSVEIVASAIQSAPDSVVEDEWKNTKVKVDSNNGVLTITNIGG